MPWKIAAGIVMTAVPPDESTFRAARRLDRYNRDCMLHFHIILQAATQPWNVTFDAAFAALEQVPGIFIEPDGSFFLVSRPGEAKWQVEGNLYDQGVYLAYVEMKGCCPERQFDDLLQPLGWPAVPLVFQMVREGTKLTEAEFRQPAGAWKPD